VTDSRELNALEDVLDLAMLDREGRPAGRVDDIEFDERQVGPPVVTAFLSGAPALARRFKGITGAVLRGVTLRLHDKPDEAIIRVPLEQVRHLNSRVDLRVSREELGIGRIDRWIVDTFIGRIPGGDIAPE
jgi:sporulation protein YlmC with PRC-barrel domain